MASVLNSLCITHDVGASVEVCGDVSPNCEPATDLIAVMPAQSGIATGGKQG